MTGRSMLVQLGLLCLAIALGAGYYFFETTVPAAVLPWLEAGDVSQREAAARRLRDMGLRARPAAEALFRHVTTDENQDAAASAAEALRGIDLERSRQAIDVLLPRLHAPEVNVRTSTAVVLQRFGPVAKPAVPALLTLLDDHDALVRERTIAALGAIALPRESVLPALERGLKDPDEIVRRRAVSALSFLPKSATVKVLAALSRDPDATSFEASARQALRSPGDADIESQTEVYVLELTQSFDKRTMRYALGQLAATGPRAAAAVPTITKVLDDDDDLVRYMAAEALAAMGPAAQGAIPALEARRDDQSAVVRMSVEEALRAIRQP